MDRNTIIGMVLMMGMLIGYQYLAPAPPPTPAPPIDKKKTPPQPTATVPQLDSIAAKAQYGEFAKAAQGAAQDVVIETEDLQLTFNSKGGVVKQVLLKKYKTYEQKPLYLLDEPSSKFALSLPTPKGLVNVSELYFTTNGSSQTIKAGQTATLSFKLEIAPNQYVEQLYTVQGKGYSVDYDLKLVGMDAALAKEPVRLQWRDALKQYENDLSENRKVVTTNYYSNGMSDIGLNATSNLEEKPEEAVQWFTHKNKYFLSGLIAKNAPFTNVVLQAMPSTDSTYISTMQSDVALSTADLKAGKGNFQFYFGPNDYQVVKAVNAPDFEDNVELGYAFLRPLNKYFFVPLFNFFEKFIGNYGILIVCLVIFIKLLLTPLVYKSYISMAKMRMLAPELAIIKEKVGDDAAKMQQEQMKLYQQVGVSPLSGCVPVLATMPVLMALFFLFPNLIELRQESFLWAKDLSTYDAPFHLPFTIPFYGAHVSVFTLLMTISQLIYAKYNNQITPQQTQPGMPDMKMLGYAMPVMFMFVMNTFPAGLSFYYFISNIVTIAQQQIIRRFVNDDKIKTILEENRKKIASGEKKKSKFSDMLEKSMRAAEDAKKQADEAKKKKK
ncbi:MAG: membrane protein insertase YidC [Runella slithyformis]|nr:MAG: membrane protein insertase YidC [Runella slithyformis]